MKPLVLVTKNKHPSPIKPTPLESQSVLMELSVSGDSNDEILAGFQEIVKNLPPNFRVSIVDAYKSSSVLFILRGSWETFLRFSNVIDLRFIGEVTGPSLPTTLFNTHKLQTLKKY